MGTVIDVADVMTTSELAVVADRVAVLAPGASAAETAVVYRVSAGQHENLAAAQLAAAADEGAILRTIHDLEFALGHLRVDPWRLLEALALRTLHNPPTEV